jgi:hypothetical protein
MGNSLSSWRSLSVGECTYERTHCENDTAIKFIEEIYMNIEIEKDDHTYKL